MTGRTITVADLLSAMSADEQWRAVADFPSYEVSSWGRVRWRGRRHLSPTRVLGYSRVCLSEKNRQSSRMVHRLVAAAFLGPPPFSGAVVAHNDGAPTNNRVENLRWASALENQRDRVRHGTRCRGSAVFGAKLAEQTIPEIRREISAGRTYADIGEQFGVSASTIYLIAKNRIWRHAGGAAWEKAT